MISSTNIKNFKLNFYLKLIHYIQTVTTSLEKEINFKQYILSEMRQYKSSSNALVQHHHTYLHFCCILAINLYSSCQHKLAAKDACSINF